MLSFGVGVLLVGGDNDAVRSFPIIGTFLEKKLPHRGPVLDELAMVRNYPHEMCILI